ALACVFPAVWPNRYLVLAPAGREAENLVTEADAEDRHAPQEPPYRLDQVRHAFRIARTVGEKDAVGLPREDLGRRRRRRPARHVARGRAKLAQDVELDPAVVRDHAEPRRGR